MSKQNIETSAFTLAKGTQLKGDDFFEVKVMDNITVAVVCDGVGSAMQGAEAAKRTCNFLVHSLKNRPKSWSMEKSIKHFIENINRVLYLESMEDYEREELVTTLTLVVIEGFHPLKHAIRFGAELLEAVSPDLYELAVLLAEYAPDLGDEIIGQVSAVDDDVFERLGPVKPPTGVMAIARRPVVDLAGLLDDPAPAPV
jgi:hypothetical protein